MTPARIYWRITYIVLGMAVAGILILAVFPATVGLTGYLGITGSLGAFTAGLWIGDALRNYDYETEENS